MATAKLFRRQAATCAAMAEQTHDEESRRRCLWLEQTYLRFAEIDELPADQMCAVAKENERKSAT